MVCQSARCEELHLHAENLSRRVWELLMLLPTCPNMLQAFQNISDEQVNKVLHVYLYYTCIFLASSVLVEFPQIGMLYSKYVKCAETRVNLINLKLNRVVSLVPKLILSFLFKNLFIKLN